MRCVLALLSMSAKIQLQSKKPKSLVSDALVVPVPAEDWQEDTNLAELEQEIGGGVVAHLEASKFNPEDASAVPLPTMGRGPANHLVIVGMRSSDPKVALVEAISQGVRTARSLRARQVAVMLPEGSDVRSSGLGAKLGAYAFDKYVTDEERTRPALEKVTVVKSGSVASKDKSELATGIHLGEGVCFARDLVNEPPNILHPGELAKRARAMAKSQKLTCKVLDHAGIKKAKMFLHDAVGKGSERPPHFIHLTYRPAKPKGRVAFVGKGITFDSGGLCLKPMQGMLDMKADMAGGAAVLGLMAAVSALAPDVEVHGIVGAAENMPDGKAYRPSDVIPSLSGKGVEIVNTDAEGRLVLADALTYAAGLKPDFIVDAATLTGATLVSLGPPYSAFFTGSDEVAEAMKEASARAGESFWRMPLIEELRQQLMSDITDIKHTGERFGGAITAALFLREFTDGLPWMHCDIPGAAYRDRASGIHPKGGTGHAVLTFLELVATHSQKRIVKNDAKASSKKKKKTASNPSSSKRGATGSKRAAGRTTTRRTQATPRRRKTRRSRD